MTGKGDGSHKGGDEKDSRIESSKNRPGASYASHLGFPQYTDDKIN